MSLIKFDMNKLESFINIVRDLPGASQIGVSFN